MFQSFIIHKFNANLLCSFLKEEWCYLDQESGISDLTVSDCWKQLPDHIEEKKLVVHFLPQCHILHIQFHSIIMSSITFALFVVVNFYQDHNTLEPYF